MAKTTSTKSGAGKGKSTPAKADQPAQPAPPAAPLPQPEQTTPIENQKTEVIIEAPVQDPEHDPLSQENNPVVDADNATDPEKLKLIKEDDQAPPVADPEPDPLDQENNPQVDPENSTSPILDPEPVEEKTDPEPPVLPEGTTVLLEPAPATDNGTISTDPEAEEVEEEAEEQEGDLRIYDDSRVPDEIKDGQSFVLGLNRKLEEGVVIHKKLKNGEHSFRVAAYHGEMDGDGGKKYHNHLVSHVYDIKNPLEKNIDRSFMRGKFDIVEK